MLAGTVVALARRAGSLNAGGQWWAFVTGTVAAAAGWPWAFLLIAFFVASSALTRWGHDRKVKRTASVLAEAQARGASQVLANGGAYAACALVGTVLGDAAWHLAACGALAAATADTWATEVGTLWGGTPRSILTGARVGVGESGGVTAVGTLASVVAAALMAVVAGSLLAGPSGFSAGAALAVGGAGLIGSAGDSLLGATLQAKRWCAQCSSFSERRIHTCHYRTQHARGVRWMTNDIVNLLATMLGAVGAVALGAA